MTTFIFKVHVVAKDGIKLCGLNLSTSTLISYHECSSVFNTLKHDLILKHCQCWGRNLLSRVAQKVNI